MSNAVDRMKLAEAVLALIEQKRVETGDELLGAAIERAVLDTQFQELEAEILENPGAIEPWLIRRRRLARQLQSGGVIAPTFFQIAVQKVKHRTIEPRLSIVRLGLQDTVIQA